MNRRLVLSVLVGLAILFASVMPALACWEPPPPPPPPTPTATLEPSPPGGVALTGINLESTDSKLSEGFPEGFVCIFHYATTNVMDPDAALRCVDVEEKQRWTGWVEIEVPWNLASHQPDGSWAVWVSVVLFSSGEPPEELQIRNPAPGVPWAWIGSTPNMIEA